MISVIETAKMLLSVCDGAHAKDGAGYNKPDSDFVNSVFRQSYAPTEKQIVAIYKILQKYKTQLTDMNIDYDAIPVPTINPVSMKEDGEEVANQMHDSASGYQLSFGKYRGKTLSEIARIDISYLLWLSRADGEIANIVKHALNGNPIPKPDLSVKLEFNNDKILIYTPREFVETCRSLSVRKWNMDKKRWESPISIIEEVISKFPGANISPKLIEIRENINKVKKLASATAGKSEIELKPGLKLMPFQVAGVEFLDAVNGNAMIADEMGLGKTIQALGYVALHPEMRPVMIICPASLKFNWEREAKKWLSDDEKITVSNGKFEIGTVNIINYDVLKKYKDEIEKLNVNVIILDESHYIKNPKSQRTKVIKEIAKNIPHKILLTGTPIQNRPVELHPQLSLINPNGWDFWSFVTQYCGAYKSQYGWDFSGTTNANELNEKLKTISIRRTKSQVLAELPAKCRTTIEIKIDNHSEYKKAERNFLAFVEENKGVDAAKRASKAQELAQIEILKQVAVKGKLAGIHEWIDNFLESGEKLVVFATHHFVIDELMERYKSISVSLTGKDSIEKRQTSVDEFQNNPRKRLFIGNLQAAGVGITLTAASNVAFVELGWTPAVISQAEDRIHRIGQKNAATINFLLARNTIDQKIGEILLRKAENIDAIMDGKETTEFSVLNELLENL